MFARLIRSLLWLASFSLVFIVGITGCGGGEDDENEWTGTWNLETIDGQGYDELLEEEGLKVSIITNIWTFNSDGTMEAQITSELESSEGGFEISADISVEIMGTYSLSGSNYTLTVTIEGDGSGFFGNSDGTNSDEDTGTWTRRGNTLTLTSDDGSTIVFKKK